MADNWLDLFFGSFMEDGLSLMLVFLQWLLKHHGLGC